MQRNYITATFPHLELLHLNGYNVRYSRTGKSFMWKLAVQIPSIISAIKNEHDRLLEIKKKYKIDAIISDNRYGLYHEDIPTIIITHQLQPISGLGYLIDKQVQRLLFSYLDRFSECWIPDLPDSPGFAGKLSHTEKMPQKHSYIGLLSQQQKQDQAEEHLLILLSGPEPQRTILAKKLWRAAKAHKGNVVFVEGSNHAPPRNQLPEHITYYRQLAMPELGKVFNKAEMVVCRSGYSTIMDLVKLQKKAILIPTPGQTEQLYLASSLHAAGIFYTTAQEDLDMESALKQASAFPYKIPQINAPYLYKEKLDKWLEKI